MTYNVSGVNTMEFNINKLNSNAINSYKAIKKTSVAEATESSEVEKKPSGNFDTVEFDFSQSIKSAKVNIASALAAEANIAKIKMLQAQYAGGNCPVSTEQIAQAIAE